MRPGWMGLAWRDFIDSIDTPGGHIVVLLLIVSGAGIAVQSGVEDLRYIMHEAFGALLLACKGAAKNLEIRKNGLDAAARGTGDGEQKS